ncbi:hypothetical protein Goari_026865 [Gossypium aridum]|uniref:RING-type E3 ubiquitin transferase n=1 Tax=Gossypium aridum TaxID=34290 RepID=A0A7J8YQK5_GOSAI|nr:hypothetical protein [Gossypium aridum]
MHGANHFLQGNYMAQPFQPAITDGGASAWTQAPGVPYMHGGNIGGPIETRYRSSTNFSHSSSLELLNHNHHHPAPPIEGVRRHGFNPQPQVAAAPYRFPANYASQSTMNPSQDNLEMGRRNRRPVPPTGFMIYHSRREGGAVPETSLRYHNLPHLRVIPPDELLALGERIGKVNTGLSEETIRSKLKTRTYSTFVTNINLEEVAPIDQEPDSCIICQEDYKNQENIGTLDCGHEYHAGCLSKWLFVKNVCPICKSEALTIKSKDV